MLGSAAKIKLNGFVPNCEVESEIKENHYGGRCRLGSGPNLETPVGIVEGRATGLANVRSRRERKSGEPRVVEGSVSIVTDGRNGGEYRVRRGGTAEYGSASKNSDLSEDLSASSPMNQSELTLTCPLA